MNLTATIPCITYLAKFLYWKERTELGKVISLNYVPGDAGYILAGLLTGKLSAEYFQDDELGTEFDAPVTFEISPRKFNYGPHRHFRRGRSLFQCLPAEEYARNVARTVSFRHAATRR